jgi:hypothetical protein
MLGRGLPKVNGAGPLLGEATNPKMAISGPRESALEGAPGSALRALRGMNLAPLPADDGAASPKSPKAHGAGHKPQGGVKTAVISAVRTAFI